MNVVFLIFNRPEQTRRVAEAIALAKPDRLLVVADGPRADRPDDQAKVAATRAVIDSIAWPCEVQYHYAETNLGCRKSVTSGLDWAFSLVEEAIILEDDLLPDPSFFPYCVELLERYRTDERVAYVGGYQFFPDLPCVANSYYFSIYGGIWGWATWRRAWRLHDDAMAAWPALKKQGWPKRIFPRTFIARFFEKTWDSMMQGFDSWGYRWYFTIRKNDMFCVMPSLNLIQNIGFGKDATHTTEVPPEYLTRKACQVRFPLCHPAKVVWNCAADNLLCEYAVPRVPGMVARMISLFGNRYVYGRVIRTLPLFGKMWARRRAAKRKKE